MSRKTLKKTAKRLEKHEETAEPQAQDKPAQEGGPSPITEMLSKYLDKDDAKAIENYTKAVIGKFTRYIKSVAIFGSKKTKITVSKKIKSHDIDIAIIVDDTDVQRMTRSELKDKLFQRLLEMGYPISKKIHPQPYLLTEFWQYVMEGNPVIYNVLRDGIIIYDSGFFMPLQMLMRMGNIKPSKETIDKHISIAKEILSLGENTMITKLSYDLEQAVVSSAQAVLMELGYRPPSPSETPEFVRRIVVNEHKLAPEKYADMAHDVVKCYKDIEHQDKKTFSGAEWDKLLKDTKEFVAKMEELLKKIRKDKGESYLYEAVEAKKNGKKLELKRPTDVDLSKDEANKAEELKEQLGQR
ncbi:MAG: hypothetical protein PHC66_02025 [Candidatus Nanoarchaeia archaeon]|nr:hypothetical protein [Candidatus Nanoarchaeia archaeon]MDD5239747.1 hypothetical protein [Candidatus Nanoarchaeia archaeon]